MKAAAALGPAKIQIKERKAPLILQNMTTWELISFNKISYISHLRSRFEAPFSRGFLRNLAYVFCNSCFFKSLFIKWEYNPSFRTRSSRFPFLDSLPIVP